MSVESLKSVFKNCIDDDLAVCVVLTLPDREDGELIITTPKNLDYKMNYYLENYNEQLELKRNPKLLEPVFLNVDDIVELTLDDFMNNYDSVLEYALSLCSKKIRNT